MVALVYHNYRLHEAFVLENKEIKVQDKISEGITCCLRTPADARSRTRQRDWLGPGLSSVVVCPELFAICWNFRRHLASVDINERDVNDEHVSDPGRRVV